MKKYDYSFLAMGNLPAHLINVISGIYSLKAGNDLRKTDYPAIYTELEKIAKVQSVKGSNAIEGIITTDERINAIVVKNSAPLNHNEAEIAGYRDALRFIHENYGDVSLSEDFVLRLHGIMLQMANPETAGLYKKEDNVIMEIDEYGRR